MKSDDPVAARATHSQGFFVVFAVFWFVSRQNPSCPAAFPTSSVFPSPRLLRTPFTTPSLFPPSSLLIAGVAQTGSLSARAHQVEPVLDPDSLCVLLSAFAVPFFLFFLPYRTTPPRGPLRKNPSRWSSKPLPCCSSSPCWPACEANFINMERGTDSWFLSAASPSKRLVCCPALA